MCYTFTNTLPLSQPHSVHPYRQLHGAPHMCTRAHTHMHTHSHIICARRHNAHINILIGQNGDCPFMYRNA